MDRSSALRVLGLAASATQPQIREAHRDLVAVWHPDRFQGNDRLRKKAEDRLKEINLARDTLIEGWDASARGQAHRNASPTSSPGEGRKAEAGGARIPYGIVTGASPPTLLAILASAIGAAAPLYVLLGRPPYGFFSFLKWIEVGAALCAWPALYKMSRNMTLLGIAMAVEVLIQVFGKMHRFQWVPYDWFGVATFSISALALTMFSRPDE